MLGHKFEKCQELLHNPPMKLLKKNVLSFAKNWCVILGADLRTLKAQVILFLSSIAVIYCGYDMVLDLIVSSLSYFEFDFESISILNLD